MVATRLATEASATAIVREFGALTLPSSGVETFTTNLDYLKVSGMEFAFSFGAPASGDYGDLTFSGNFNQYFENESKADATTPVLDCLGYYGASCGNPLPESRFIQRTTWNWGNFEASYLWQYLRLDRDRACAEGRHLPESSARSARRTTSTCTSGTRCSRTSSSA